MKYTLPLLLIVFVSQCVASTVAITTTSVPNGTVEAAYSAVIEATGGCGPFKWAVASGTLPTGVAAEESASRSLTLKGSPTTAGSYSFTISITGCEGHVSEVSYEIVVQATSAYVVDLSWNVSTSGGVVGYNVYRGPDGVNWTRLNASPVATTVYSDSTVSADSTYYYAATAVNGSGDESQKTTAIKVTVP